MSTEKEIEEKEIEKLTHEIKERVLHLWGRHCPLGFALHSGRRLRLLEQVYKGVDKEDQEYMEHFIAVAKDRVESRYFDLDQVHNLNTKASNEVLNEIWGRLRSIMLWYTAKYRWSLDSWHISRIAYFDRVDHLNLSIAVGRIVKDSHFKEEIIIEKKDVFLSLSNGENFTALFSLLNKHGFNPKCY